jgi:hypothetical protein
MALQEWSSGTRRAVPFFAKANRETYRAILDRLQEFIDTCDEARSDKFDKMARRMYREAMCVRSTKRCI